MFDLIANEHTAFMTAKRPKCLSVIGADLDMDLCRALVEGDKVLMEINGTRTFSTQRNPLIADFPWEVVSNRWHRKDKIVNGQLTLKHPSHPSNVVLDYSHAIKTARKQPCVFVEEDASIVPGQLFVILQMVGFRISEDQVDVVFPPLKPSELTGFRDALKDNFIKMELFKDWYRIFQKMPEGWQYNNDRRFAIRAKVKVGVVTALRQGDFQALLKVSDNDVISMFRECYWLPMLLRQSDFISHDYATTYDYTSAGT